MRTLVCTAEYTAPSGTGPSTALGVIEVLNLLSCSTETTVMAHGARCVPCIWCVMSCNMHVTGWACMPAFAVCCGSCMQTTSQPVTASVKPATRSLPYYYSYLYSYYYYSLS